MKLFPSTKISIQRAAMDRRTTMRRVAEVVLETLDEPEDAAPPS